MVLLITTANVLQCISRYVLKNVSYCPRCGSLAVQKYVAKKRKVGGPYHSSLTGRGSVPLMLASTGVSRSSGSLACLSGWKRLNPTTPGHSLEGSVVNPLKNSVFAYHTSQLENSTHYFGRDHSIRSWTRRKDPHFYASIKHFKKSMLSTSEELRHKNIPGEAKTTASVCGA